METFVRRLAVLEYLRVSTNSQSTSDILRHLISGDYLEGSSDDKSLLRTVQRDMKFLHGEVDEDGEASNEFGLEIASGEGRTTLWRLDPYTDLHFDYEKMPQYMALAFSMTRKHLIDILPKNTATELTRFFLQAENRLEMSEKSLSPKLYKRLNDSIEFYQRGQRLQPAPFDMDVLDTIYRAIIQNKQVAFSYRGKDYEVHPYGVAILLPKLYLVGKKQSDAHSEHGGFRSFLVNKIDSIYVLNRPAIIPEEFKLKDYLDQGEMDVLLDNDRQTYKLSMKINATNNRSHLIDDLMDNPIASDQCIEQISASEYLLSANVRRSIQLRNWLLSMGSVCEVVTPEVIKQDLIDYLEASLAVYQK